MSLKSMTGFGRAEGSLDGVSWAWEVRSVNGRGLDLRPRLAPGYDALEPKVRERVAKTVVRGSVAASLQVRRAGGSGALEVNKLALETVLAAIADLRGRGGFAESRPEGVLALRGVLEQGEVADTEAASAARAKAIISDFDRALVDLDSNRRSEGARLADVIAAQIDTVAGLVATVEQSPARSVAAIKARLRDQIARLLEASDGALSEDRLYQEAVLAATKADVEEELKRLGAHIAAARELLTAREPAGRKFDFLAQEFNREANTLCSKANDPEITRAGLALKTVIDQMREQVQNIE